MITVIDYGLGNLSAFVNVYKRLNIDERKSKTNNEVIKFEKKESSNIIDDVFIEMKDDEE